MLHDKFFLKLAKSFNLKLGKTAIFGAYKDQYLAITRTQQGFDIYFYIYNGLAEELKKVFISKESLKITGSRFHTYEIEDDVLIIRNVKAGLRSAIGFENIQDVIEKVIEKLFPFQRFAEASTDKTILIEGIPGPDTDSRIQKMQSLRISQARDNHENDLAIALIIPIAILLGFLFGAVSGYLRTRLNGDFNDIAKGIMSLASLVLIFRYLSKGITLRGKIFIILGSLVCLTIWIPITFYYYSIFKTGQDRNIQDFFLWYFSGLFSLKGEMIFAILGYIFTIFVGLGIKLTDELKLNIENGESVYQEIEEKIILVNRMKLYGLVTWGTSVILFGFFVIRLSPYSEGIIYPSKVPFITIGVILVTFFSFILGRVLSKWEILNLALTGFKDGAEGNLRKFFFVSAYLVVPSVAVCYGISALNIVLAQGHKSKVIGSVIDYLHYGKNECAEISIELEDGESVKPWICKKDYKGLNFNDEILLSRNEGFFGFTFYSELRVPARQSIEIYLKKFDLSNLRYDHLSDLMKYDKSEKLATVLKNLKPDCLETPDYRCRLAGYSARVEGNLKSWSLFMRRGCLEGNDPVACRNLTIDSASSKEKALAYNKLKEDCLSGSNSSCIEWAWSLPRKDKEQYKKVIQTFGIACERGDQEACKLKKNFE